MELIFKIICCSAVFIGFYRFVLQREKMFRFNRFYLLATLVLSFCIPFMELGIREFSAPQLEEFIPIVQQNQIESAEVANPIVPVSENVTPTSVSVKESNSFPKLNLIAILGIVGLLITLILFVRFLFNLWKISRLALQNEKIRKDGFMLVKINRNVSPFSFFHYLFASKQDVENEKIRPEIFYHEFAHIRQKHTWDVVFVEFLLIFFWFNPFLYIYRKSIRTNHEFLADQEVLNHDFDTKTYQHLLLEKIPVNSQTSLSSSFNYLVTKKRLIMMTKQTSKFKTLALKFFSIPLLIIVMLTFSEKVAAQVEPGEGVSKELFREYKKQIRRATVKVKDENGKKVKKIDTSKLDKKLMNDVYAQMSPEQKMKVHPIPNPKPKVFEFNSPDNLVLNLNDLNLDEIVKLGVNAGDLGIKIADDVISKLNIVDFESIDVKYFDSAEWEEKMAEMEAYYNSPEWQEKIEKIEMNAKEIEEYYNSPEWKAKIEKIEQNAKGIEEYFNSPEWKQKIENIEKETEKAVKEAEKAAKEAEKSAQEKERKKA